MPEKGSTPALGSMPTRTQMENTDQPNTIPSDASKSQHNQHDPLPSYSENSRTTSSPTSPWNQQLLLATPGLPNVNVLAYLPANASLSSDQTTVTVRDEELVTVPAALVSFIFAQAALPPRPIVRIRGSVCGNVAFDLKIDMMRYFVPKSDEPAWNYVKIVDEHELAPRGESTVSAKPHYDTLLEWAQRFINSLAGNKS